MGLLPRFFFFPFLMSALEKSFFPFLERFLVSSGTLTNNTDVDFLDTQTTVLQLEYTVHADKIGQETGTD